MTHRRVRRSSGLRSTMPLQPAPWWLSQPAIVLSMPKTPHPQTVPKQSPLLPRDRPVDVPRIVTTAQWSTSLLLVATVVTVAVTRCPAGQSARRSGAAPLPSHRGRQPTPTTKAPAWPPRMWLGSLHCSTVSNHLPPLQKFWRLCARM